MKTQKKANLGWLIKNISNFNLDLVIGDIDAIDFEQRGVSEGTFTLFLGIFGKNRNSR